MMTFVLKLVCVFIGHVLCDEFLTYDMFKGKPYTITSDGRSWMINDQRTLLLGGSIHYPRFTPSQWPTILKQAKNDGLNHVEIYIFWNLHEQYYNFNGTHIYNYDDRADLVQFLQDISDAGLFVNLRFGPYVCAEWSFGGLPTWLLHDDSVLFRYSSESWQNYMAGFMREIASKVEPFLARNGGPIILAQIENEYHDNDAGGKQYIEWCGQLATQLALNVSWVMCNGMSASDTINTCNGNDCYGYAKNHVNEYPNDPLGWTENEGWFQSWGSYYNPDQYSPPSGQSNNRSPQWLAYTVAIWVASGGSHHNYYMYFGGNHISKWAGSSITNYYADGVNYHGDNLPNEPKRTHMARLHKILASFNSALMGNDIQINNEIPIYPPNNNTKNSFLFAYQYTNKQNSSDKVTFLINMDTKNSYNISYNSMIYYLPMQSVSILDANSNEVYNTGKVNATGLATKRTYKTIYGGNTLTFQSWMEPIPLKGRPDNTVISQSPLEQIRYSNDSFEYVYYSTNFTLTKSYQNMHIVFDARCANAYIVLINGVYYGESFNYAHNACGVSGKIEAKGPFNSGTYNLVILSSSLGIDNYNGIAAGKGPDYQDKKGLVGKVTLTDSNNHNIVDLTNNNWAHNIGLTGEQLGIPMNINAVTWDNNVDGNSSLTWYKTTFNTPDSQYITNDGVILLDIGTNGMNRGHFYINGIDLGHYNNVVDRGLVIQQYYFIPNDIFKTNGDINTLLFAEELPGINIKNINIVYSTFVVPS